MIGDILHGVATVPILFLFTWKVAESEGYYSIPSRECPNILSYSNTPGGLVGHVIIPRSYDDSEHEIKINYCVPHTTVQSWSEDRLTFNNEDERRLIFKLFFSFASPVPAIRSITFNDEVICQRPMDNDAANKCVWISNIQHVAPRNMRERQNQNQSKTRCQCMSDCSTSLTPSSVQKVCGIRQIQVLPTSTDAGVTEGEWPWVVAILHQQLPSGLNVICGGSLIDNLHIVTNARCLLDSRNRAIDHRELFAKVGAHDVARYFEDHTEIVGISGVKLYPGYIPDNLINNIAIVTLSKNISFTPYIQPVCLWGSKDGQSNILDRIATVISWGQRGNATQTSAYPQKRTVPIVPCHNIDSADIEKMYENTFCAGSLDQPGICQGDSGSGLYFEEDGNWGLRGIISSPVTGVCTLGQKIIYTDVAIYKQWIQRNI